MIKKNVVIGLVNAKSQVGENMDISFKRKVIFNCQINIFCDNIKLYIELNKLQKFFLLCKLV